MVEPVTILVHRSPGVVTLSSHKQRAPAQHGKKRGRLGFLASDWNYFYLLGAMMLQVSFLFLLLNSGGCFLLAVKHSGLVSPEVRSFLLMYVF